MARAGGRLKITAIVCAYNEAQFLAPCLYSLKAQTRPPDEILVVDNASADATAAVARRVAGVRVLSEPCKGLVVARETARRAAAGDVLLYLDADCRAPLRWVEHIERRFSRAAESGDSSLVALTGPYRFFDWDRTGSLLRMYDHLVAPPVHALVHDVLRVGAILYGGNFAVRASVLDRIGGFDRSIEFHGEDTNLGRRLTAVGTVRICPECWLWTSARRYRAMGKAAVFRLYVRNFWSEILLHRPSDREHLDVRM